MHGVFVIECMHTINAQMLNGYHLKALMYKSVCTSRVSCTQIGNACMVSLKFFTVLH